MQGGFQNLAGATLAVDHGTIVLSGGSAALDGLTTGAGQLYIAAGETATVAATATVDIDTLGVADGGDLAFAGSSIYAGDFYADGGATLDLEGHILTLSGEGDAVSSYLIGGGTLVATGTLFDGNDGSGVYLSGDGTELRDEGKIVQNGYIQLGTAAADTTTLDIAAGATYDLLADAGIGAAGTASIVNAGLLEKIDADGGSTLDGTFDNFAGATLAVDQGYIAFYDGSATLDGLLTGGGQIYLAAGEAATLAATATLDVGTLGVAYESNLAIEGSRAYAGDFYANGGATVDLEGNTLTLSGDDDALYSYLIGGGTVAATGTLFDGNDGSGVFLSGDGTELLDENKIVQNGYVQLGTVAADITTLEIAAGATYDLLADDGIGAVGTASIVNAGTLEKIDAAGGSTLEGAFQNLAGATLAVGQGYIALYDGSATLDGLLTGGGQIYVAAGETATVAATATMDIGTLGVAGGGEVAFESSRSFAGDFYANGASTLDTEGHVITLSGSADAMAGILQGGGTLDATGTLFDGGNGSGIYLTGAGTELLDDGTVIQNGYIQLGETKADTTTLDIAAGATYDVIDDSNIGTVGTASILNAGLFEKTANTGPTTIDAAFVNTGTVDGALGTIAFDSNLENDGEVIVTGSVDVADAVTAATGDHGRFAVDGWALQFGGAVAASQTVAFDGNGGDLVIGTASEFLGTITGFAAGDTIDLLGVEANHATLSGSKLTLSDVAGGTTTDVATLDVTGITAGETVDLRLDPAGNGTDIAIDRPGAAFAYPSATIASDTFDATAGSWSTAGDWLVGLPGSLNAAVLPNTGSVTFATTATVNSILTTSTQQFAQTSGTLTVDDGGSFGGAYSASGGTLVAVNGLTFSGGFALGAGASLISDGNPVVIENVGTTALGGTLGGAGEIDIEGGTYTIEAGAALTSGVLAIENSANVQLAEDVTYAGTLTIGGGNGPTLNGHTLTLTGLAFLYGGVAGPGTLRVTGTAQDSYFRVYQGATFDDAGTVLQVAGNAPTFEGALLTIESAGTWDIVASTQISDNGVAGTIANAGLFEKTADTSATAVFDSFRNTGTLDVSSGTIALYAGGTLGGTVTGLGELDLRGGGSGLYTLAAGLVLNVGTLALYDGGSEVTLAGNLSYAGSLILGSSGIGLGGFTLTLGGLDNLGNYNITDGTVLIDGTADIGNITVYDDATIADAGLMLQYQQVNLGNSGSDEVALTIAVAATYDILVDAGIGVSGTVGIDNSGLFEKTGDTGYTVVSPSFTNESTATLDVAVGGIGLYGGGVLAGMIEGGGELDLRGRNAGQFTLAAGAVLSVATLGLYDGGSDLFLGGDATYAGHFILGSSGLELAGFTLTLSGIANLGYYNIGGGVLDLTGTASFGNVTVWNDATIVDSGAMTQDGQVNVGTSANDTSKLYVNAGATYDIVVDSGIGSNGSTEIRNAGLFEKTGDTGYSSISTFFANVSGATLNVAAGTVALYGGGTLAGTIEGAGELDLRGSSGVYTIEAGAVVTVGTLAFYDAGSNVFLGGDLSYAGDLILGSSGFTLDGHTLTLGGSTNLGYYNIRDGVIDVTGSADIGNVTVYGGATIVDAGTMTQDNGVTFGNTSSDHGGTFDCRQRKLRRPERRRDRRERDGRDRQCRTAGKVRRCRHHQHPGHADEYRDGAGHGGRVRHRRHGQRRRRHADRRRVGDRVGRIVGRDRDHRRGDHDRRRRHRPVRHGRKAVQRSVRIDADRTEPDRDCQHRHAGTGRRPRLHDRQQFAGCRPDRAGGRHPGRRRLDHRFDRRRHRRRRVARPGERWRDRGDRRLVASCRRRHRDRHAEDRQRRHA